MSVAAFDDTQGSTYNSREETTEVLDHITDSKLLQLTGNKGQIIQATHHHRPKYHLHVTPGRNTISIGMFPPQSLIDKLTDHRSVISMV